MIQNHVDADMIQKLLMQDVAENGDGLGVFRGILWGILMYAIIGVTLWVTIW